MSTPELLELVDEANAQGYLDGYDDGYEAGLEDARPTRLEWATLLAANALVSAAAAWGTLWLLR